VDPAHDATLTVSRTSDQDAKQRQVYVSLAGQQIAYLMFGDSVTRRIAPGKHTLKVNNTLVWKSVEFEARAGEEVRFSVVNYSGKGFALLLTLFGVSLLFLRIERR
jgi:hypothetical protein